MQTVTTREILTSRRAYLTGPMMTPEQRGELGQAAALLTVPVADRQSDWLWDAEALLVLPGADACSHARCDITLAECSAILVHHLAMPAMLARSA
ncbi:hypothetical protein ATKI12_6942 [Kitasatospora sp. Ki12]